MAFLKRITPYAIAVLLLAVFYVPPPLGKSPYEYLRTFSLYRTDLPSVQATHYQYLMFVVQWPFAVCADRTCDYKPLPDFFTIHGIWPSNDRYPWPVCEGTRFDKSEIEKQTELMEKLKASWPDLLRNKYMKFWEHEYDDHGRCCDDIFPQTKYFRRAHEMWSTYRVEVMFQAAGYRPGNSYMLTDLQAAIKRKTQKDPALRCKNLKLLVEVVICYEHDGKNVIDCKSDLSRASTVRCSTAEPILYRGR